jgi:predicted RNase H-like nuclease
MAIARSSLHLGVVFRRAMLVALAGIGCSTKAADVVATLDEAGAPEAGVSEAGVAVEAGKEAAPPDPCQPKPYSPTPPDTCGDYFRYPCGLPPDLTIRGDCIFGLNDCALLCPDVHFSCRAADGYCSDAGADADAADIVGTVVPDEAGAVVIDCATCPGSAGRVPAGLEPAKVRARSALGAYFASAARLEAASVTAFRRLREELAMHGAPEELLDAARHAERDEVRHTLAMARLARRHGGRYVRPHVADIAARSLETIAEENVIEGCARETFGALVATWQAAHVVDAATARTLATIAEDETRHAALSWEIARWSLAKLDATTRARLEIAWSAALDAVSHGADVVDVAHVAGLPSREERAALAGELRGLWTELAAA